MSSLCPHCMGIAGGPGPDCPSGCGFTKAVPLCIAVHPPPASAQLSLEREDEHSLPW